MTRHRRWPREFVLRGEPWRIIYCCANTMAKLSAVFPDPKVRGKTLLGHCDLEGCTIHVLRTLPAKEKRRVLRHEMHHAQTLGTSMRKLVSLAMDHEEAADHYGDMAAEIEETLR